MTEDERRQPQTPLDRERLRLEQQGHTPMSGGLLGCLIVGLIGMLLLLIVQLLALL